jgi:hypothetical protein
VTIRSIADTLLELSRWQWALTAVFPVTFAVLTVERSFECF